MEEPIRFRNKDGKTLFGIVHIPQQPLLGEKKVGINLLNPGIKYRVAPNRLNVKLARELCKRGYYVLRFDPIGIGDSEGDLPEDELIPNIWEKIQTGLFVQDIMDGNDFIIKKYEIDKLYIIGNCGGAISALLTSSVDLRISGLCLVDVPVNLRETKMTFAEKVLEGGVKADWYFSEYIKRLFRLKSWYRFVTFQTNYKALLKTMHIKLRKNIFIDNDNLRLPDNIDNLCSERKLNRLFFKSVDAFLNNRMCILFVLAGNDPGTEIFYTYFQNGYLKVRQLKRNDQDLIDIFCIENANHVYALSEWQHSLINKISTWLDSKQL
jgi:uncharacterized protein